MTQQPLFDKIDQRIALDKEDSDYAYLHALSFKLEYLTKVVTAGLIACVGDDADRHRYSLEHKLVRADSLGEWVEVLNPEFPISTCLGGFRSPFPMRTS